MVDDSYYAYMDLGQQVTSVLEHHGILGMKWGVRRYQNKDGSRTDAGKKRYEDMTPQEKREYTKKKNARKQRIRAGLVIGANVAVVAAPFIINAINSRSSGRRYNSYNRGQESDYERRSREAYEAWQRGKKAAEEAGKRHAKTTYKQAVKMTPAEAKARLDRIMKEAAAMESNGGMDVNMKNRVMEARDAYKAAKAAAGQ